MARNGQNAISIHKNDTFPIIMPILVHNRLVLNNSWVYVLFSIFGQFQVAGNGQKWQNVILMHYTINNDIY